MPRTAVNSRGEKVTVKVALDTARKLGRFTRRQFAQEIGLKPIQASSWLAELRADFGLEDFEERGEVFFAMPKEDIEAAESSPEPEPESPEPEPEPKPKPEKPEEFQRFEELAEKLVGVPKAEAKAERSTEEVDPMAEWRETAKTAALERRREILDGIQVQVQEIAEIDAMLRVLGVEPPDAGIRSGPLPVPAVATPVAPPPIEGREGISDRVLAVLTDKGPLTAKRLREELGVDHLGNVLFDLEQARKIHRDARRERGQVRFGAGPSPVQDLIDDTGGEDRRPSEGVSETPATSGASPTSASRAEKLERVREAARRLGIFNSARLAEASGVARGTLKALLDVLLDEGLVARHGDATVTFYTHKAYDGPVTRDLARGREEPEEPVVEQPPEDLIPEDLVQYPAAQTGGPLEVRIATARKQQRIVEIVEKRGEEGKTTVAAEVLHADPSLYGGVNPTVSVNKQLVDLASAGLIVATGKARLHEKQSAGRGANEYRPLVTAARVDVEEEPEVTLDDTSPDEPGDVTIEDVRDFVVKQKGKFSFAHVCKALGEVAEGKAALVEEHLAALEEQGTIKDVSPFPDMKLYEWVKPTGPGRAAELDAKRRQSERVANGGGGAPVPGTGRQTQPSNSDVKKLVAEVRARGFTCEPASSGHWIVEGNGLKKRVLISGTPRGPRTVANDRARLRKAGVLA